MSFRGHLLQEWIGFDPTVNTIADFRPEARPRTGHGEAETLRVPPNYDAPE